MTKNTFLTHQFSELDKLKEHKEGLENDIRIHCDEIQKEANLKAQAIRDSYEPLLQKELNEINKLITSIGKELDGAIICENLSERAYFVEGFNQDTLEVFLQQLSDKNGLSLKEPKSVTRKFESLSSVHALHRNEIDQFMKSLADKKITIQYQLVEIEDNEKLCCPVHIGPRGISLQDYEIKYDRGQAIISDIFSKEDGNVKFDAIQISEECGLIRESIVEVFTAEVNPHILNILHLHINDMKIEIPVEAVYIMDSQSADDYSD